MSEPPTDRRKSRRRGRRTEDQRSVQMRPIAITIFLLTYGLMWGALALGAWLYQDQQQDRDEKNVEQVDRVRKLVDDVARLQVNATRLQVERTSASCERGNDIRVVILKVADQSAVRLTQGERAGLQPRRFENGRCVLGP